jgi:hypothetical protein
MFVVQSEFQQTASKFSIEYFTGKLAHSRCPLSERRANSLEVLFKIVSHGEPQKDQTSASNAADIYPVIHE